MKKSKVKKSVVKLTVIRNSQYDRYMKKFQSNATCQCRAIYGRSIKPAPSDFSLLKTLRKIMSNMADQKSKLSCHIKRNMPLSLGIMGQTR